MLTILACRKQKYKYYTLLSRFNEFKDRVLQTLNILDRIPVNQLSKEKIMGMFFDDEIEKPVPPQKENVNTHPGFFAAAGLMILGFFIMILTVILKQPLMYLFNFEGRTRNQVTTQLVVIFVIFGGAIFILYRIPFVRDWVSLSNVRTININSKERIFFPDRSNFVIDVNSKWFRFREGDDNDYLTYSGYTEHLAQNMQRSQCQLVPRSEKILLSSESEPRQAEGFEEEVRYSVRKSVPNIHGLNSALIHWANPSFFFKSKEFLDTQEFTLPEENSWREFMNDWNQISTIRGTNSRWFLIKAKSDQHAVICF